MGGYQGSELEDIMEKKAGFLFKDDNITLYNDGKEKHQSYELEVEVVIDGAEARLWGYGHDSFEAYSDGLEICDDLLKSLEDIKARITRLRDTVGEGKDPEFVSAKAFKHYERDYLYESVEGFPDCGSCPGLNITQHGQEALRRKNIPLFEIPNHRCSRYRERLFHYWNSNMIEPCEQCLKENFNKEN